MSHLTPQQMPLIDTGSQATCKCCGAVAIPFGTVDFHKNCEQHRRAVLKPSGVHIQYYRCPTCEFIFTTAFDRFTADDFKKWIYNDQYILVDPEYAGIRPGRMARGIADLIGQYKGVRVLDYGGGSGLLAGKLRETGFSDVSNYDPFVAAASARPQGKFDIILCVEVIEHSPYPKQTIADMAAMLKEPGVILISTLFQPADIDRLGKNWWYIAPRNGHVSLFSRNSMFALASALGLQLGTWSDESHVLCNGLPDFARGWFTAS